jgi:hypothetical protein
MLDFFFSDRCFDDARVYEFFSGGFDELLFLTLGSSSFWIEAFGIFRHEKAHFGLSDPAIPQFNPTKNKWKWQLFARQNH